MARDIRYVTNTERLNMLKYIARWQKKRLTRIELNYLSVRELNDIGLTKGDIDSIVENI